MRRREFITLLAGAAVWEPRIVVAEESDRTRLIAALVNLTEDDPVAKARIAAFQRKLENFGWSEGRNLHIEYHFGADIAARDEALAKKLVTLRPDLILAHGHTMVALHRATRTIPIVFVNVAEPVAQSFVESLAHPGGNITGFMHLEPSIGAKWLDLLKEIAPHVSRVTIMLNPDITFAGLFSGSAEEVSQKFGVQVVATTVHEPAEIEAVLTTLGREPGGGLILPAETFTTVHRKLIIELAARHRLPLVTANSAFPKEGGLMYYGADATDLYRRAARYVDRILRGEKPADLPVQAPTKFELVINLKTAKALGLDVPPALLARADEVIE